MFNQIYSFICHLQVTSHGTIAYIDRVWEKNHLEKTLQVNIPFEIKSYVKVLLSDVSSILTISSQH